jgi:hypothetical protein
MSKMKMRITTSRGLVKYIRGENRKVNAYGNSSVDYDNFIFETRKDYDLFMASKTRKEKYGASTFFRSIGGYYYISVFKK